MVRRELISAILERARDLEGPVARLLSHLIRIRSLSGDELDGSVWGRGASHHKAGMAATAGVFAVPTVGFGPGDERFAHAPNERCEIAQLFRAVAFYAAFGFFWTEESGGSM